MKSRSYRFGSLGLLSILAAMFIFTSAPAAAATTIVALGASNTYGKGVARSQAYPAQLEAALRAQGIQATVVNIATPGNTTTDAVNKVGQVPAKLFDAMALGRPVVSTRVSMIPEILDGCGLIAWTSVPFALSSAAS